MNGKKINVLVLEDHSESAEAIKKTLEREGVNVYVSGDPYKALNWMRMRPFHLCYIDCLLPKMNGMMVAKQLKKQNEAIFICLLSGIMKEGLVKSFPHDIFFKKPITSEMILNVFKQFKKNFLSNIEKEEEQETSISQIFSHPTFLEGIVEGGFFQGKDDLKGFHVFYILSLYLNQKKKGCLKVTKKDGSITSFIYFKNGLLYDMKGTESQEEVFSKLIIKNKILSEEEWNVLDKRQIIVNLEKHKKVKKEHLEKIREFQFNHSLKKIYLNQSQFYFKVIEHETEASQFPFRKNFWPQILKENVSQSFLGNYWLEFFKQFSTAKVFFKKDISLEEEDLWWPFSKKMKEVLAKDMSISKVISSFPDRTEEAMFYLGYLILRGVLEFVVDKKIKNPESTLKNVGGVQKDIFKPRLELMFKKFQGRSPYEIFQYFGASSKSSPEDLKKLYREFVDYNHVDKLPIDTKKEVLELNKRIFQLVKEAYETLTDPSRKADYEKAYESKQRKLRLYAEGCYEKSVLCIRKKEWNKSIEFCEKGLELTPKNSELNMQWIFSHLLKANVLKERLSQKILDQIDGRLKILKKKDINLEKYYFIKGLYYKQMKDFKKTKTYLEKAIELKPDFVQAKKELEFVKYAIRKKENEGTETIITRFFRKKSS